MKLLTTSKEFQTEFTRLSKQYKEYYWTTAWAGINSTAFKELCENKSKIKKIVVGLHFYQTHPEFIKTFLETINVKYIKQPEGTFHPKMYLFYDNKNSWEIMIGSANFTNSAFTKNTEANMIISCSDAGSADTIKKAFDIIENSWNDSSIFSEKELESYRITWNNLRPKIRSLSGTYGDKGGNSKSLYDAASINMTWIDFCNGVKEESQHTLNGRIDVLVFAKKCFTDYNHYSSMTSDERKFIAGLPNKMDSDVSKLWGWFGSMKGAGIFAHHIDTNDINISNALDNIPVSGQITKTHYINFIKEYRKSFESGYVVTASRLLAMKRPDTFFCITSKNKKKFCKAFNIKYSTINYEGYWDHVIERIFDCDWWLNPRPANELEATISNFRAAFLDSLFYEHLLFS